LRGKKATTWEGGQRVPAILVWPDIIAANQVNREMVTSMDLMPTLAGIINAEIPEELILDGLDISDNILGSGDSSIPERPFYYYARNGDLEAMRLGKWKLHTGKTIGWNGGEPFKTALYNLDVNVSESENIADEHPEIVDKMKGMMSEFDLSLERN
jgi:arylsulfatase A-like enzyme